MILKNITCPLCGSDLKIEYEDNHRELFENDVQMAVEGILEMSDLTRALDEGPFVVECLNKKCSAEFEINDDNAVVFYDGFGSKAGFYTNNRWIPMEAQAWINNNEIKPITSKIFPEGKYADTESIISPVSDISAVEKIINAKPEKPFVNPYPHPVAKFTDEVRTLPTKFYWEFECLSCETHVLVEASSMDDLYDEESWPRCPHCFGSMAVDWKHQVQLVRSVDVRTSGCLTSTEDIGEIDYRKSDKYIDYEKPNDIKFLKNDLTGKE